MKEAIFGVVRAVLAAVGGWAVAQGWVDESTVEQVVGAVLVIATAAWSVRSKLA